MDELDTKWPFYGSRRMVAALRQDGVMVNRKRVRRLMRVMGLEAIYQKPNTSKGHPDHKVYPYLLRGLSIDRPNQVWCADITYIPMAKGFVYLVAIRRSCQHMLSSDHCGGPSCVVGLRMYRNGGTT